MAEINTSTGDPRFPAAMSPASLIWGGVIIVLAVCGAVTLLFAAIEHLHLKVRLGGGLERGQRRPARRPLVGLDSTRSSRRQSTAILAAGAVAPFFLLMSGLPIPAGGSPVLVPVPAWQTFRSGYYCFHFSEWQRQC